MNAVMQNFTGVFPAPIILLVEDSSADAKMLKTVFLEKAFGGALEWVRDGAAALDFVFGRGKYVGFPLPALILLDLNLPKVGGLEVLSQVRSNASTANIPIIILTTSNRPEDRERSIQGGASSFYTKPSELEELRRLVDHLKLVDLPRLGVHV